MSDDAVGESGESIVQIAHSNLALVMAGNVLGGTILVALVYWFVYFRSSN